MTIKSFCAALALTIATSVPAAAIAQDAVETTRTTSTTTNRDFPWGLLGLLGLAGLIPRKRNDVVNVDNRTRHD